MGPIKLFLCFAIFLQFCESANILYVIPFTSKSHYMLLKPIGLELAKRGHNVTVITPFLEDNPPPNYRVVKVEDKKIWEFAADKKQINVFTMVGLSAEQFHTDILWGGTYAFTESTLKSTDIQNFLAADNKFDLVICEQFFQDAFAILAHKYNAPLALVTTFGNCMKCNIAMRNSIQEAVVTSEFLPVTEPTSFQGRLRNWYFTVYEYVWWKYWYLPKHDALIKKYIPNLPEPVPSLYEVQRNVSLMMLNSHFSFDTPTAYLPNVVEIGGLHLSKSDGKLPKDLQNVLDNATNGVVYVNFGTNIRSYELPEEKRNALLNVFRRLKQTVLWKWEDDELENKPDNLVIRKWMPQKEILAHPNIKVFISHGGLIGTQEAIFNGVPIIGMPIYCDQYNNLLQVQEIGFGKILLYHDLKESVVESMLLDILNNNTYKIKAMEVARRFKDRPLSGLDTAMFWIEYLLRNKDHGYFKNPGLQMNWFAYYMIDVYAFVTFVVVTVVYILVKLISLVLSANSSKKIKEKKKRN